MEIAPEEDVELCDEGAETNLKQTSTSDIIKVTSSQHGQEKKPSAVAAPAYSSIIGEYQRGSTRLPTNKVIQKTNDPSHPSYLTKELDAFYHVFIDRFQAIEKELMQNRLSSQEIITFLKNTSAGFAGQDKLTQQHQQLVHILEKIKTQPSLKDLFVHIVHFI